MNLSLPQQSTAISTASPCHCGTRHPPIAHLAPPSFGRAAHSSVCTLCHTDQAQHGGHPTCTTTQLSSSEHPSAATLSTHGPDCTCDRARPHPVHQSREKGPGTLKVHAQEGLKVQSTLEEVHWVEATHTRPIPPTNTRLTLVHCIHSLIHQLTCTSPTATPL